MAGAADYKSWSAPALKIECANRKIVQTGTKDKLINRLCIADRGAGLNLPDGRDPFSLKVGDLRKQAAQLGASPIGNLDEILERVVDALVTARPAAAEPAGGDGGGGANASDARAVAEKVLALAEQDDWEAILCLGAGGGSVSAASPTNDLRKAYRKLSIVIHPDKLRGFDGATRAFQALVTALDRVTNPEPPEVEDGGSAGRKKAQRIARSNEGCERTSVACPRCKEEWGASSQEGLPSYAYNFMMTGLRTYTCSTCLCDFGCVSALHFCSKCKKKSKKNKKMPTFDYSPADYHRKIECGDCGHKFGFWSYHVSDRAMDDAIKEARATFEANAKARASKIRRAASRNRGGKDDAPSAKEAEASFVLGLTDNCPRCGVVPEEGCERRGHLADCTDAQAHKKHAARTEQSSARVRDRDADEERMEAAQAKATWDAAGGQTAQLWMLPDACLIEMAGGDDDARNCSRAELISRAAASRDGVLLLTDGDALAPSRKAKRRKLDVESLPSNYASLPADRLREICAAHGFIPKGESKDAVINAIENELHGVKDAPLLLTGGKGGDGDEGDADFCVEKATRDDDGE